MQNSINSHDRINGGNNVGFACRLVVRKSIGFTDKSDIRIHFGIYGRFDVRCSVCINSPAKRSTHICIYGYVQIKYSVRLMFLFYLLCNHNISRKKKCPYFYNLKTHTYIWEYNFLKISKINKPMHKAYEERSFDYETKIKNQLY